MSQSGCYSQQEILQDHHHSSSDPQCTIFETAVQLPRLQTVEKTELTSVRAWVQRTHWKCLLIGCTSIIKKDQRKPNNVTNRKTHLTGKHKLEDPTRRQSTSTGNNIKRDFQDLAPKELSHDFKQAEFEQAIIDFITATNQPFSIIEDENFISLLCKVAGRDLEIPKADAIQSKIVEQYNLAKDKR